MELASTLNQAKPGAKSNCINVEFLNIRKQPGPSESSVLLPSGESVRWMPILWCGKPDFRMGVLENGDWAVEDKAGLRHLDEQPSYLYVMALLEQPAISVRERLKAFFSASDIGSVFPFANVVRAGLDQKSEYWADLAFRWLGEIPEEGRISLEDSVARIADAGWASQKLRQKAKKELKRLGYKWLTAEKIYDQAMSLPNDSRRLLVERLVRTENFPHPESSDNDDMTRKISDSDRRRACRQTYRDFRIKADPV